MNKERGYSSATNNTEANNNQVLSLSRYRTKKQFSQIKGLGFSLLSSGISKTVIKSPLTVVDATRKAITLNDPSILLALDLIGQNKGILYLSLNAPKDEIIGKMILALAGLDEIQIQKGALEEPKNQENFDKACSIIYNSKIHIGELDFLNSLWITASELKQEEQIDAIIIDDFHSISFELLNDSTKEPTSARQDLMEHFNEMSINIGLPVILLSRNI